MFSLYLQKKTPVNKRIQVLGLRSAGVLLRSIYPSVRDLLSEEYLPLRLIHRVPLYKGCVETCF